MTFDGIALALALVAIALRMLDQGYWSNLCASASFAASTIAGIQARRRRAEADALARSERP